MKNYLKCFVVIAVIAACVVCDWSFVSESLKLSDTCLLWMNGRVSGWIEIVFMCIIMDAFISVPAIMIWDDINEMKL